MKANELMVGDWVHVEAHRGFNAQNAKVETISDILNTLEVKEVDLCEEEERIWKDFNIGECHLSKNDLEKIAKHFYELGLKAQKGEEVC